MTGRERCEEIMRLIDEALESVPPVAEGRSRLRPADLDSGPRPTAKSSGRPRR